MATSTTSVPTESTPLVGEMVHYRQRQHCWAAAIVDGGPDDSAQLYLLPLPPSFPMPAAPGTYVPHDGRRAEETWHRLEECATPGRQRRSRRRRSRDPK